MSLLTSEAPPVVSFTQGTIHLQLNKSTKDYITNKWAAVHFWERGEQEGADANKDCMCDTWLIERSGWFAQQGAYLVKLVYTITALFLQTVVDAFLAVATSLFTVATLGLLDTAREAAKQRVYNLLIADTLTWGGLVVGLFSAPVYDMANAFHLGTYRWLVHEKGPGAQNGGCGAIDCDK
jgi:hypothetical protein